jgi:ribosomal-protein-alanine N-acetyltransferase
VTAALPRVGDRVHIRRPTPEDREAFVEAAQRSRRLLHPWVEAPDSDRAFEAFLTRARRPNAVSLLVCRNRDGAIVGCYNLGEIVRRAFQSAFLGYYAFRPHAGKGYMGEGIELVVAHAFDRMGLHRIQANVQPANTSSIELLRRHGFHQEGASPKYLFIDGAWRDHLNFVRLHEPDDVWNGWPKLAAGLRSAGRKV